MSGASGTLPLGALGPDFDLPDTHGQQVRLHDLHGRPVVLVFFPFAFTGVCTSEMRGLAERHREIETAGARLLVVSTDTRYALRTFAEIEGLPFTLLSDFWPHGAVAQAYGCFDADRGCAERASFVLDPELRVRWSVRNEIGIPRDLDAHLRAVVQSGS